MITADSLSALTMGEKNASFMSEDTTTLGCSGKLEENSESEANTGSANTAAMKGSLNFKCIEAWKRMLMKLLVEERLRKPGEIIIFLRD